MWNRTASACIPSRRRRAAATAADACASSDVTFVMVSTPEAALACAEAAAPGLTAGKCYLDVSTEEAGTSSAVASIVRGAGASFLEAPVSGSKAPAEQGAIIFMAAGDEALFDRIQGPLVVMGKASFFLGEVGAGAKMKLIVNPSWLHDGSSRRASPHGEGGVDQETLLKIVSSAPPTRPCSPQGPEHDQGRVPAGVPARHQQKDMRFALGGGRTSRRCPSPRRRTRCTTARRMGKDDEDFSAVIAAIRKQ